MSKHIRYYTATADYRFKSATKSSTFTSDLGWRKMKVRTNTLRSQVYVRKVGSFSEPPSPPPTHAHTAHKHHFYGVTSGFTRLTIITNMIAMT